MPSAGPTSAACARERRRSPRAAPCRSHCHSAWPASWPTGRSGRSCSGEAVGLLRLAFEDHGDADELRARAASRRASREARAHADRAADELQSYLLGQTTEIRCPLDWEALAARDREALAATLEIPYGDHRSYTGLDGEHRAYEVGLTMGANPIPIVAPCHRVTRGVERPQVFVGGSERRRWLDAHERQHAGSEVSS